MDSLRLLVSLCFAASCVSSQSTITIEYTAENLITMDDQVFSARLIMETEAKPFIEIMDEAALIDSRFRYTTIVYEGHGHYVTSINNVYENVGQETAWVLLKKTGDEYCRLNVGISTYIPYDGEHMVYQLETWDIHQRLPLCPDA